MRESRFRRVDRVIDKVTKWALVFAMAIFLTRLAFAIAGVLMRRF